ncbi:hypothetical protein Ddye_016892 [Dipteronia dyeriana]|uniref:Uncharacterized protein n=1 Tax=Dipteronia dyeriana TaxID=168575 RepID=A0AAD9U8B2_9ROSI|nr:hypothetical protein Ddye_016892 [Dipteronia dyeriana]
MNHAFVIAPRYCSTSLSHGFLPALPDSNSLLRSKSCSIRPCLSYRSAASHITKALLPKGACCKSVGDWFAWNVFNRLGTGLDRPDFQLDMGVKQSQNNNHGTRLAYERLYR